jgi:hypothetical protein
LGAVFGETTNMKFTNLPRPKGQGGGKKGGGARGAADWGPPRRGVRAIGQFVEDLTRPAFAKYGFSAAVILTQWEAIAGPEMAAYTAPERLKWPHPTEFDDDDNADDRRRRSGAILVLRVSGPRAVEIQHRSRELIERINASFGFCAVTQIRIIQAPVDPRAQSQWRQKLKSSGVHGAGKTAGGRAPELKSRPEALDLVEDERLREALERMAKGVARRAAGEL